MSFLVGSLAGFVASALTSPLDVVKTRLQTQTPSSLTQYNGVLDGLREIYANEGAKALFRGTTARATNMGLATGIMMGCYGVFRASFATRLGLGASAAPSAAAHRSYASTAGATDARDGARDYGQPQHLPTRLQMWTTDPSFNVEGPFDIGPWPTAGRPPPPPPPMRRVPSSGLDEATGAADYGFIRPLSMASSQQRASAAAASAAAAAVESRGAPQRGAEPGAAAHGNAAEAPRPLEHGFIRPLALPSIGLPWNRLKGRPPPDSSS